MLGKIREIKLCLQWTYFRRILVIGNHCGDKHVRSDQKNLFNRKTIVVIIFKIVVSSVVYSTLVWELILYFSYEYLSVQGIFAFRIAWKNIKTLCKSIRCSRIVPHRLLAAQGGSNLRKSAKSLPWASFLYVNSTVHWHFFLEIWAKVKKKSAIKPPLSTVRAPL